jgi:hypothetical protein
MKKIKLTIPAIRLIRRDSAERYMSLTLFSFAASVTITRLFLSLSGYPQIGGGELHIAHVLWGGLLLYLGALLPLIFSNREVYTGGAILAGVGIGLFIDEVGKFITQSNNYFFPVAAPIIYIFFLLSIILLLQIRRPVYAPKYAKLARALDIITESLNERPFEDEWNQVEADLESILEVPPSPRQAELARALLQFIKAESAPLPTRQRLQLKPSERLQKIITRVLPDKGLRTLLILGLVGIGGLMLKNPLSLLLSRWLSPEIGTFLANLHLGRQIEVASTPGWFETRLVLEVVAGLALLVSAFLLIAKRERQGVVVGIIGLLASLTTVDLLLFYFEQFSTIITTTIQFLLLFGLYYYRDRIASRERRQAELPVENTP